MNWRSVQYYLTFCQTLNFTRAARQLDISQPALAKAINRLEEQLGTVLINREAQKNVLTEHGELIRDKYADLADEAAKIINGLKHDVRGDNEKITIAIVPPINFTQFAYFLTDFHRRCPSAYLDIIECSAQAGDAMLRQGKLDCILTVNPNSINTRTRHIELYENSLYIGGSSKAQLNEATNHAEFDSLNNELLLNQIFKFSEKGALKCVASCSEHLWTQQLINAGLGLGVQSEQTRGTKNTSLVSEPPIDQAKTTIFATVPLGRNDNTTFILFIDLLNSYRWQE